MEILYQFKWVCESEVFCPRSLSFNFPPVVNLLPNRTIPNISHENEIKQDFVSIHRCTQSHATASGLFSSEWKKWNTAIAGTEKNRPSKPRNSFRIHRLPANLRHLRLPTWLYPVLLIFSWSLHSSEFRVPNTILEYSCPLVYRSFRYHHYGPAGLNVRCREQCAIKKKKKKTVNSVCTLHEAQCNYILKTKTKKKKYFMNFSPPFLYF